METVARRAALAVVLAAALGSVVRGQAAPPTGGGEDETGGKAQGSILEFGLRFGSLYNSNIIQLSRNDIDSYLNRDPAGRFALESVDDGVFRGAASVSFTRALVGSRASRVAYEYIRTAHARNPIDDSFGHSLSLRQPLGKKSWVSGAWLARPSSYLRNLWDIDFQAPYASYPRYQRARLRARTVRLAGGSTLRPGRTLSLELARTDRRYNPEFRERDSHTWEASAALRFPGPGPTVLSVGPAFESRVARATDRAHPEVPDSLRDDVSFRALGAELGISLSPFARTSLSTTLTFRRKAFTSDRPLDVYHHGRHDNDFRLALDLDRTVRGWISVFVIGQYEVQTSSGVSGPPEAADEGAFRQSQIGGGIRLSWAHRI